MKFEETKYNDFYKLKNKYFKNDVNLIVKVIGLAVPIKSEDKKSQIYILQIENNKIGYKYKDLYDLFKKKSMKIISFEKENNKYYTFGFDNHFFNYFKEINL